MTSADYKRANWLLCGAVYFAMLCVILFNALTGNYVEPEGARDMRSGVGVVCFEDDSSCWDCATMGNRVCGADDGD